MQRSYGTHVLADLFGAHSLTDVDALRAALYAAANSAGAKVLADHFHPFPDRSGVTGVVLLAESHISIHTWPEDGFAAVDIFMCGDMSTEAALARILEALKPAGHTVKRIERSGPPAT